MVEQVKQIRKQQQAARLGKRQGASPSQFFRSRIAKLVTPQLDTLAPNSAFMKTYRLHNDGSSAWAADTRLVLVSKHNVFAAPSAIPLGREVRPNEFIDIPIQLQAPSYALLWWIIWFSSFLYSYRGTFFGIEQVEWPLHRHLPFGVQ
jgi:hypothetical protein